MKRLFITLALLMVSAISIGQMTKKIKNHTFENGMEIKIGSTIELISGKNPSQEGSFLWVFEGTNKPIPKKHCDATFDGRKFELVELLSLKGIPEKDDSIIGVFYIDKKKFYCFINQSLKYGEISF